MSSGVTAWEIAEASAPSRSDSPSQPIPGLGRAVSLMSHDRLQGVGVDTHLFPSSAPARLPRRSVCYQVGGTVELRTTALSVFSLSLIPAVGGNDEGG